MQAAALGAFLGTLVGYWRRRNNEKFDWSSLLQLAGVTVGSLIFGAIAWPDDFRRNPPPKRDRSPQR